MDFEAGLPILVASLVAVILLSWLTVERRLIDRQARRFGAGPLPPQLVVERVRNRVSRVTWAATLTAPVVMAFSGQLDAHGVAHVFHDALQIIAPLTSALFSAAVAWLLILSPRVVHRARVALLECLGCVRERRELC